MLLTNVDGGGEFDVGGGVAEQEFDWRGFDGELLLVPVGEVFGFQRDLDGFGFVWCERDAVEAFQLFVWAGDFGGEVLDVELDDFVAGTCAGVGDID